MPAENYYAELGIDLNDHRYCFPDHDDIDRHCEQIDLSPRQTAIVKLLKDREFKSDHDDILLAEMLGTNRDTATFFFKDAEDIAKKMAMDDSYDHTLVALMKMKDHEIKNEIALLIKHLYVAFLLVRKTDEPQHFVAFLLRWRKKMDKAIGKIERDDGRYKGERYIANLGNLLDATVCHIATYFVFLHYEPQEEAKKYTTNKVVGDKIPMNNKCISQILKGIVTSLKGSIEEKFPELHLSRDKNVTFCFSDLLAVGLDSGSGMNKDGSKNSGAYKKDLNMFIKLSGLNDVLPLPEGEKKQQGFTKGRNLFELVGIGGLLANVLLKQLWTKEKADILPAGKEPGIALGNVRGGESSEASGVANVHASTTHPECYANRSHFKSPTWSKDDLIAVDTATYDYYISVVKIFGEKVTKFLSDYTWVAPIAQKYAGKYQVEWKCSCCREKATYVQVCDENAENDGFNEDLLRESLRCDCCMLEAEDEFNFIPLSGTCNRCGVRERCSEGNGKWCQGCHEQMDAKKRERDNQRYTGNKVEREALQQKKEEEGVLNDKQEARLQELLDARDKTNKREKQRYADNKEEREALQQKKEEEGVLNDEQETRLQKLLDARDKTNKREKQRYADNKEEREALQQKKEEEGVLNDKQEARLQELLDARDKKRERDNQRYADKSEHQAKLQAISKTFLDSDASNEELMASKTAYRAKTLAKRRGLGEGLLSGIHDGYWKRIHALIVPALNGRQGGCRRLRIRIKIPAQVKNKEQSICASSPKRSCGKRKMIDETESRNKMKLKRVFVSRSGSKYGQNPNRIKLQYEYVSAHPPTTPPQHAQQAIVVS